MWMLPRVLVTTLQGRPHRFMGGTSPYQFSTFCFTLAAILSSRPVHTFADPIRPAPRRRGGDRRRERDKNCPFYGCPVYPTDVHYSPEPIKSVLETLRELKMNQVNDDIFSKETSMWNRRDAACLTLIGYKGGPREFFCSLQAIYLSRE